MGKMHIYDDLIQNYLPLPQPFDELFTIIADHIGLSYGFSCCNLGSAKFQLEGERERGRSGKSFSKAKGKK